MYDLSGGLFTVRLSKPENTKRIRHRFIDGQELLFIIPDDVTDADLDSISLIAPLLGCKRVGKEREDLQVKVSIDHNLPPSDGSLGDDDPSITRVVLARNTSDAQCAQQ